MWKNLCFENTNLKLEKVCHEDLHLCTQYKKTISLKRAETKPSRHLLSGLNL